MVEANDGALNGCTYQVECQIDAEYGDYSGGSCGNGCIYEFDENGIAQEQYVTSSGSRERISNDLYGIGCTESLALCYKAGRLAFFDENELIEFDEFEELLGTIAEDMYYGWTPEDWIGGYLANRHAFDTPFYNGGGIGGSSNPPYGSNDQVCIESLGCWGRSEINYIGQGMWGAASGASLEQTLEVTETWNSLSPSGEATDGELFWTEYGYNWYMKWLGQ